MIEGTTQPAERMIGAAAPYRVTTFGEEVAFLLSDLSTGAERLLAFAEAHAFRCELRFLRLSHQTAGSADADMPWEDCVARLVQRHLSLHPAALTGQHSSQAAG